MVAVVEEEGVEVSGEVGRQLVGDGIHGALESSYFLPENQQENNVHHLPKRLRFFAILKPSIKEQLILVIDHEH